MDDEIQQVITPYLSTADGIIDGQREVDDWTTRKTGIWGNSKGMPEWPQPVNRGILEDVDGIVKNKGDRKRIPIGSGKGDDDDENGADNLRGWLHHDECGFPGEMDG